MVPLTRRRLLRGAAAASVALAGCNGSGTNSDPEPTERPENIDRDPPNYALRSPRDEPPIRIDHEEDSPGPQYRTLIADPETAARVSFADVDGADEARAFVEETDLDSQTLVLDSRRVGECYWFELCYVTWTDTEYRTYYGRRYRDVDVACRTDRDEWTSRLVRLPDVLDPEQVTGSGSGWSSNGCRGSGIRMAAASDAALSAESEDDE